MQITTLHIGCIDAPILSNDGYIRVYDVDLCIRIGVSTFSFVCIRILSILESIPSGCRKIVLSRNYWVLSFHVAVLGCT